VVVVAGVDYSIFLTSSNAGLTTVNILKAPSTLVGVAFGGSYLGIVLDAVRTAYIPNSAPNGTLSPIIPVSWSFSGLQISIIAQIGGQEIVLFFGTVLRGSISLDAYAGVVATVSGTNSGSGTANVSASTTLQFPSGALRLTGIAYLFADSNSNNDVWSFTTAGGLLVSGLAVANFSFGGSYVIVPLDDVFTAQSLSVSVTMNGVAAGKTHSAYIIAYYRF
jgi:hypothetical protein